MYNKKSDYAINKRNPDAIVYTDADKNEIKLTRDDFESEEEFLRWKAWSDAEYKQAEKNGRGYYDHTVALIDDADTYGETLDDELFALADKLEHDEKCAAMVAQIRTVLTETQFRRLWLYCVCRKTEQEIADFNELADLITNVTVPDESEDVTEPKNSEAESDEETQATEPQAPAPVFTRNLAPLFEKNADCIGWVYIENTAVDYPVMHTPSEPQRYLRLNFDKEYSTAGVPFLKGKCTMECDNLIIYGHNMKNGTMFSDVTQYRNKDYCTEHPVIEFETAEGMKQYTVFAVVYVKNNDGWYDFHTADNETEFNEKIEGLKRRALYDTGITPEYGQQLLTLSTCYGATKSDRIIVIGVETTL